MVNNGRKINRSNAEAGGDQEKLGGWGAEKEVTKRNREPTRPPFGGSRLENGHHHIE